MKIFNILLLSLLTLPMIGFSQSTLQGSIKDTEGKGVAFANVLLLNRPDSVLVKGTVTDVDGYYTLSNIPNGNYIIESCMVGYAKSFSPPITVEEKNNLSIEAVTLTEDIHELDEVLVKATKPLYEVEMGKMVVNVQSSITSAGLSVIDVLERSPGIFVNRQNNAFSLHGKNGVIVLMNGKRSRMPMEAVYQMLEGMNAGDIEKIEIMTVPPANYDADGDAGFINIVMKKGNGVIGTNGTVMVSLGHGLKPLAKTSLNLNHQGRRLSLYGNYSLNFARNEILWNNYRENSIGAETVSSSTELVNEAKRLAHNFQFGLDYQLGNNTTLSGLMSGYDNRYKGQPVTNSVYDYSVSADTLIESINNASDHWQHLMGNLNIQHIFQKGQVLNVNLDFLTYFNTNPSHYHNRYYTQQESSLREEEIRLSKDTPIDLWVVKIDHSMNIGEIITWESGIKGTYSHLINDILIKEKKDTRWTIDETFSVRADLSEDIHAAFSALKIKPDKNTMVNAGVRYEYTKTYMNTEEEEGVVDRKYGNFFPTFFISRKLNQHHLIQLSYGRRITRPTFNEMAPWVTFQDPHTFFSGNANILPTFTHSIKTDYSYKNLTFSLQYSHDKDVIMRFQPQLDLTTNTMTFTSGNVDRSHTLATTITLLFQVTPWWEMQNNLSANWQKIINKGDGEQYERTQRGLQINTTQTFNLPKKYTLELTGLYFSSSIANEYFKWRAREIINLGIQKEFNHGGTLRLSCNNIFESQARWETFEEASFDLHGNFRWDKRQFFITYTQKFGNNKVNGVRKRSVGSKEEQNRVTN